jgi:hypothetical protein
MTKMARLKQEAREAARLKGHRLGRFRESVVIGEGSAPVQRSVVVAVCQVCGAMAVVDPAPARDEPEILGEAVEWQCFGIDREGHETA